ncbi:RNA dependent RNA polymerase-domain-containing protein [Hypoxylon sp. FL1284]|nr:RNA dependent RNA polymerase-domain-containing protein [Hypoxylon sp. FL1284]
MPRAYLRWSSRAEKTHFTLPPSARLNQESYSPTEDDIEALEEAWSQYTSSQSQQTEVSPSPSTQDYQESSPSIVNSNPTSSDPPLYPRLPAVAHLDRGVVDESDLDPNDTARENLPLEAYLRFVWPRLPPGLQEAPFNVKWEFMRAALHCSTNPADIENIDMRYTKGWCDQNELWKSLKHHPHFMSRELPDMCDSQAWNDGLRDGSQSIGRAVALTATVRLQPSATGLEMQMELNPLRSEKSCRLTRRFGSNRFFELRIPALDSWKIPGLPQEGLEILVARWLTRSTHSFLGRDWAAFWTRSEARKSTAKTSAADSDAAIMGFERVSLFATNDADCSSTRKPTQLDNDESRRLSKCTRDEMLQWLLQFDNNADESYLKLFSRVSLGLTKATPAIVFGEDQIRHQEDDILSPTGNEMNDGIGRVSLSVLRKIRDILDLDYTPCAVQARLGSAKGMWIADTTDPDQDDWIETYPTQRKWKCDWSDEYHRTLEIKACASPLRPANLNLQFLPILEDRAIDKTRMRNTIAEHLATELSRDLESLKIAIKNPQLFRQWAWETSPQSEYRSHEVPFLAGLPDNDRDKMAFLLDGGFDPMKQKYLQDMVFRRQRQKCEKLETELRVKIARSTYAFMIIDFLGVLEPDEVHLCFSSKFADGSDERYDLDGMDVLVARSPAHLPSDIQKVRAVFKPELRHLKDVVIFPRTGDIPLAHKLSGGDYDGDKAWVCWEPEIVNNFDSVDLPEKPDFSGYLKRDKQKITSFVEENDGDGVDGMIERAFAFSLRPKLLGICTSYKERLCYYYNSISNAPVVNLSWFLGELADQAKNGIIFGNAEWQRFRHDLIGEKLRLAKPAYKTDRTAAMTHADHIIDHLRFVVAKRIIESELRSLNDSYKAEPAYLFDADVTNHWNEFEKTVGNPDHKGEPKEGWVLSLRQDLKDQLTACCNEWQRRMTAKRDYRSDVLDIYDRWWSIEPYVDPDVERDNVTLSQLQQSGTRPPELSNWRLLQASMTFKMFHKTNAGFVWQIAGRQIQYIKALKSSADAGKVPALVVPSIYAALRPDSKYIKRITVGQVGGGGDPDPDSNDDDDLYFKDALEDLADEDLDALGSAVGNLSVG